MAASDQNRERDAALAMMKIARVRVVDGGEAVRVDVPGREMMLFYPDDEDELSTAERVEVWLTETLLPALGVRVVDELSDATFGEIGIDSVRAVKPSGTNEWSVELTAAWAGWLAPAEGKGESFRDALMEAVNDLLSRREQQADGR